MNQWIVNEENLPKSIILFDELLCGCGCPQICWELLHIYLMCKNSSNNWLKLNRPFELFFAYVIDVHCKMTEHGTSIYGSWLTEEGKKALNWLDKNISKVGNMVICYKEN